MNRLPKANTGGRSCHTLKVRGHRGPWSSEPIETRRAFWAQDLHEAGRWLSAAQASGDRAQITLAKKAVDEATAALAGIDAEGQQVAA